MNITLPIHANQAVSIQIPCGQNLLESEITLPDTSRGALVVLAVEPGSCFRTAFYEFVAYRIQEAGYGTLLVSPSSGSVEELGKNPHEHLLPDVRRLGASYIAVANWLYSNSLTKRLRVGYFGYGPCGAAALLGANAAHDKPNSIVSVGGWLDHVHQTLRKVKCPTLLIAGGECDPRSEMNHDAFLEMRCQKKFVNLPGATNVFVEPDALDAVSLETVDWYLRTLR